MLKPSREHRGEEQRIKKRKLWNRRDAFLLNTFQFDWGKKKSHFQSVEQSHAWIVPIFKWSVGSCSSTKSSWKTLQFTSSLACGIIQDKGSTSTACATHWQNKPVYTGREHVLLWSALTACAPADQPSYRLHCSHLLLQGKWSLGHIKPKQNGSGRIVLRQNSLFTGI